MEKEEVGRVTISYFLNEFCYKRNQKNRVVTGGGNGTKKVLKVGRYYTRLV